MHIVIFDDEAIFCNILDTHIQAICTEQSRPDITTQSFTSFDACSESMAQSLPAIAFLDIVDKNDEDAGFRLAKQFRKTSAHGHIVFVSGYLDKQALALQDLIRPSGFLTKPIDKLAVQQLLQNIAFAYADETAITIKMGIRTERIPVGDIIYIERVRRKLVLHTATLRCETSGTLDSMLQTLRARSPHFLQVDRGTIVNLKHVQRAFYGHKRMLHMSNDFAIVFAESHISAIKQGLELLS